MKQTRIRQLLPLDKFETISWVPIVRRRSNAARRAPALPRRQWRPGTTAADLAARLLAAWQGGAR